MKLTTRVGVTIIGVGSLAVAALHFFHADKHAPILPSAPVESPFSNARTPVQETQEFAPARSILVQNGLLSLVLREQPLGPVLTEISKKSGVKIYSLPTIDTRFVTLELRGVPLERGLQELLKDCDVFFYNSAGILRSAWVYDKDTGAQLLPVPPESWASTADVERQINGGSPAERISAIETLVARNVPSSGEAVNRALLDENADVRLRALDVALSAGVSVSREALTSLTYDSSTPVRALALEAIASGTPLGGSREAETEQLIQRMMGDPDTEVRTKASELLDARRTAN
jgi:hypothetical protein